MHLFNSSVDSRAHPAYHPAASPSPAHPGSAGRCTSVRIVQRVNKSTKQVGDHEKFMESTPLLDSRKLLYSQSGSYTRDIYHLSRFQGNLSPLCVVVLPSLQLWPNLPGLLPCKRPCIDVCASSRLLSLALLRFRRFFTAAWIDATLVCIDSVFFGAFSPSFRASFGGWKCCSG